MSTSAGLQSKRRSRTTALQWRTNVRAPRKASLFLQAAQRHASGDVILRCCCRGLCVYFGHGPHTPKTDREVITKGPKGD